MNLPETTATKQAQSNSLDERESIYQPEQDGLIFPRAKVFDTIDEEREHRKQRLVAGCRAFAMHQPHGCAFLAGQNVQSNPRRS